MAAAADLSGAVGGEPHGWMRALLGRHRPGCLADGVGEGEEIVTGRAEGVGIRRQAHDLPPTRSAQTIAVGFAEVVGMGLGIRGERPQDGSLIGVDVGQGGHRRAPAGGTRTATGRTHDADGTS